MDAQYNSHCDFKDEYLGCVYLAIHEQVQRHQTRRPSITHGADDGAGNFLRERSRQLRRGTNLYPHASLSANCHVAAKISAEWNSC